MLTKKDVIQIGKAIARGGLIEINKLKGNDQAKVIDIRGVVLTTLDEFWYEVVPVKVREQFREPTHLGSHNAFVYICLDVLDGKSD